MRFLVCQALWLARPCRPANALGGGGPGKGPWRCSGLVSPRRVPRGAISSRRRRRGGTRSPHRRALGFSCRRRFQAAAGFFDARVSTDAGRNRASSVVRRTRAWAPRSRRFARVSARARRARGSPRVAASASFPSLTAARFFRFPRHVVQNSTDYISRLLHEDEHPRSASAAPLSHGDSEFHRSMSAVDLVRPLKTTTHRPFPGETRTRTRPSVSFPKNSSPSLRAPQIDAHSELTTHYSHTTNHSERRRRRFRRRLVHARRRFGARRARARAPHAALVQHKQHRESVRRRRRRSKRGTSWIRRLRGGPAHRGVRRDRRRRPRRAPEPIGDRAAAAFRERGVRESPRERLAR